MIRPLRMVQNASMRCRVGLMPSFPHQRLNFSSCAPFSKEKYEFDEETVAKLKADKPLKPEDLDDMKFDVEGDKLGFAALPEAFVRILKITVVGVSLLLVIKLLVNDKKNKKYNEGNENNDSEVLRPGFPTGPSMVQRKSEYEGAGSSYVTRKSGDKLF